MASAGSAGPSRKDRQSHDARIRAECGVGPDTFISYGHEDKLVADAVCARLEQRGIRCWIAPRDLQPGQSYGEGITVALHTCRVLVLVFSDHANLSRHVANEVERAVSNNLTVIPFRIQDVKPGASLEFFIGSVHWLDALTPPLEQHLDHLADSVGRLLGAGQSKPAPSPSSTSAVEPAVERRPRLSAAMVTAIVAVLIALGALIYASMNSARSTGSTTSTNIASTSTPAPLTTAAPAAPPPSAAPVASVAPPPAAAPAASTVPPLAAAPASSAAPPPPAQAAQRPDPAVTGASSLAGCWVYNNTKFTMRENGAVDGVVEGHWTSTSPGHYVINWQSSIDTVVLSPDGSTLAGTPNDGPAFIAKRAGGSPLGPTGAWRWPDGTTTVLAGNGTSRNGPITGTWTQVSGDTYRIVWNYSFTDSVALSDDGRTLTGRNQLNTLVGGRRLPCSN